MGVRGHRRPPFSRSPTPTRTKRPRRAGGTKCAPVRGGARDADQVDLAQAHLVALGGRAGDVRIWTGWTGPAPRPRSRLPGRPPAARAGPRFGDDGVPCRLDALRARGSGPSRLGLLRAVRRERRRPAAGRARRPRPVPRSRARKARRGDEGNARGCGERLGARDRGLAGLSLLRGRPDPVSPGRGSGRNVPRIRVLDAEGRRPGRQHRLARALDRLNRRRAPPSPARHRA